MFEFEIEKRCEKTGASRHTAPPHGDIKTPVYMPGGDAGGSEGDDACTGEGYGRPDYTGKYVSPLFAPGLCPRTAGRRSASFYELG